MLLRDDVPADRQAEPGAFTGRLGREERLKQLFARLGPDAGAVVAHPDLDLGTKLVCDHLEARLECRITRLLGALVRGVKPVADQVQENA